MRFCSECAGETIVRIPPGDHFEREVCSVCGKIFYENPKLVVGTLPRWEQSIVLCRRAIEPRKGYWTLPSGFLEKGETVEQGAARETLEESGAQVVIDQLFVVFSIPHVSQVYLLFLADLEAAHIEPGLESSEVAFFRETEIPWSSLAFRAIEFALDLYIRQGHRSGVQVGSYARSPGDPWIRAADPNETR